MLARNALAAIALAGAVSAANAAGAHVRFVLDFLLQGHQSPFVLGRDRGYYAAQGVNLTAAALPAAQVFDASFLPPVGERQIGK